MIAEESAEQFLVWMPRSQLHCLMMMSVLNFSKFISVLMRDYIVSQVYESLKRQHVMLASFEESVFVVSRKDLPLYSL